MTETSIDVHPARAASQRSMAAVKAQDRAGWLALWAEDGCVEDPVGVSWLDPTGEGHRGKDAIGRFFEFFLRSDSVETTLGLSSAQWTSVVLFAVAAVGAALALRRPAAPT